MPPGYKGVAPMGLMRVLFVFRIKMNGSMCFERLPQVLLFPPFAGAGLVRSLSLSRSLSLNRTVFRLELKLKLHPIFSLKKKEMSRGSDGNKTGNEDIGHLVSNNEFLSK